MGMSRRTSRRGALLALLCAFAVPAVAWPASVPRRLIDRSNVPAVPKVLRDQGPNFVMTRVRIVSPKRIRRRFLACARDRRALSGRAVVERIGVNGRTITFAARDSTLEGCDRNPKARAIQKPWCGGSAWVLRSGRVSDARLDICTDRNGNGVVAFGWINPLRHAKWIVVDQPGFREIYPVAAHLPVRVSTVSEIGTPTTFRTSQYDGHGVLLARKVVVASIAS
jgi:hypothetical protein